MTAGIVYSTPPPPSTHPSNFICFYAFCLSRCKWGTFVIPLPKYSSGVANWPLWCPLWCAASCCCSALWVGCLHTLAIRWRTGAYHRNRPSRCGMTQKEFRGRVFLHLLHHFWNTKSPLFLLSPAPSVCTRFCSVCRNTCAKHVLLEVKIDAGVFTSLLCICSQMFTEAFFLVVYGWRNCWKPTKILNKNSHKVFFTQLNIFLGTFQSYLLHWKLSLHDYVLSFAALVVYCTKSRRAERYWQKTLLQMEEMESQIREEIRKGVFMQEPTNLHTNSHFL